MNANGWELIYTDDFLEALALIHRYLATQSEARARKLSSGLMNFTIDKIPLNPYAFVEYSLMKTPEAAYRRGIYKRTYAVIYKVESGNLIYIDVYHTSRNKGNADN